jgi:hypothetical protein
MASLALLVKGIRPQRPLPFSFLSLVALTAGRRLLPLFVDVMMAIRALDAIPLVPGVLPVIKEHVPGDIFEHDPERLLRRFHRVSGIADHGHQEQDRRQRTG